MTFSSSNIKSVDIEINVRGNDNAQKIRIGLACSQWEFFFWIFIKYSSRNGIVLYVFLADAPKQKVEFREQKKIFL